MTETESRWQERVQAWRASGLKAAVFAAEHGYSESTLRWWASQLSRPPEARQRRDQTRSEPSKPVVLARVVRKAAPDQADMPGRPETQARYLRALGEATEAAFAARTAAGPLLDELLRLARRRGGGVRS